MESGSEIFDTSPVCNSSAKDPRCVRNCKRARASCGGGRHCRRAREGELSAETGKVKKLDVDLTRTKDSLTEAEKALAEIGESLENAQKENAERERLMHQKQMLEHNEYDYKP